MATISASEQALLEANQADDGSIQVQKTITAEEAALYEANQNQQTLEEFQQSEENRLDTQKNSNRSITTAKTNTNSQATQQDVVNFQQFEDWRVRLSLAPGANYLYKALNTYNANEAGILKPLADTNGVIFPYTPAISVNYAANYDSTEVVHSNYKIFQYRSSNVDNISITCDFTAQDTFEANYLLAVIHFFKSITKMFYGLDQNPRRGTPPPLVYLTGLGTFQFNAHPLAVTSFTYNLPTDVDYIRAGTVTTEAGQNQSVVINPISTYDASVTRLGSDLKPGGFKSDPKFSGPIVGTVEPTYVPTKIQLSIGAIPIISRNTISNQFSLKDYATGALLRGTQRGTGGVW